jgi:hypothetical protein
MPASGTGTGERGHAKTVEAMKWMMQNHLYGSYYVPAHLERAGPFNRNGNNGFNVEHLRDFNNAAPTVAFGMETQPGHGASDARGEYTIRRNNFGGINIDSVGGTTYGGTGVYGAQIGGVWDALLGEGRNFWFFASSDWHNRGMFGPDDRRSTQDSYPGEYQRDFVMVRDQDQEHGKDKRKEVLSPQEIVDGLRSGNSFAVSGQLIDRLAFVACADTRLEDWLGNALLEGAALAAAANNTDINLGNCAAMGEKLIVRPGSEVVVAIVARDPSSTNYSPYTFANPSLAQVGISQPLNKPVLDHIDVIRGDVTGYKTPGAPDYSGQWPDDWITNPNMDNVPAGAKNASAAVLRTFSSGSWKSFPGDRQFKVMLFRIPAVTSSQYLRLRGTNCPRRCRTRPTPTAIRCRTWRRMPRWSTRPRPAEATACLRTPTCAFRARRSGRTTSTGARRTCRPSTARSWSPMTSLRGRTCGSTAIRSSSRSGARRSLPA